MYFLYMRIASTAQRRNSPEKWIYRSAMSFFAVLFALIIEQARPLARGNLIHANLRRWARWASRSLDAGKPQHGWVTGCCGVSVWCWPLPGVWPCST
jgi:hypothetical protein